jgi:hypothetical protein
MTLKVTKAVLASHIAFSVGWLGSVAVFVALAVTSINSQNPAVVNGALIALQISSYYIIVPFCFLALVTGIIQARGTKWGLFKYYWIVVKLFLTVVSTLLLLVHLSPITMLAEMASQKTTMVMDMKKVQVRVLFDAAAGLVVLIFVTAISIYKPWGRLPFRPTTPVINSANDNTIKMRTKKYLLPIVIGGILIAFLLIHLFTGGMHGH